MTLSEVARLVLIFVVLGLAIMSFNSEAGELKYKLNLLPKSWHHGSTNATNERHEGVGLSVTMPNGYTYAAMHFKNSYGDNGWMIGASKEFKPLFGVIYPGFGVGYAPSYAESGHSTAIAWLAFRYRWVTMMTAPGEVTTFVFSIPLN